MSRWKKTLRYEKRHVITKRDMSIQKDTCGYEKRHVNMTRQYENNQKRPRKETYSQPLICTNGGRVRKRDVVT